MNANRRTVALGLAAGLASLAIPAASAAQPETPKPQDVLRAWYRLVLELVRHTATYSPPVASRTFAYLGVAAYEAVAGGSTGLRPLAGQLQGLRPVPKREPGRIYDEAVVVHAVLTYCVKDCFANTGPTGQRAMTKLGEKLRVQVAAGLPPDIIARSEAHGRAVAAHVLEWSRGDGGAVIENMGFPLEYKLTKDPANWMPTSLVAQQQFPLLPNWGRNRTFAMPDGGACGLPGPPEYSEDKQSAFYKEALEVYETKQKITPEQRAVARFWSDDPMLTSTPPGHWMSIALQILERNKASLEMSVDVLARLGIVLSDAFVACWHAKFKYDLVRPVTYVRRVIDPKWEALLNTPPFPEYPSGHSTQSGGAAEVLSKCFGDTYAFEDATHQRDGLRPRNFASFRAAAEEAGISRLYGGIHFRSAIDHGLEQGRCVAAYVNALKTRV